MEEQEKINIRKVLKRKIGVWYTENIISGYCLSYFILGKEKIRRKVYTHA